MNTEPLALRLADRLSGHGGLTFVEMHAAAAELRRLHAELQRCKQVCAATSEAWREEAALGCDHCNHPLYAATRCRVCGRVTEPVQEPVAWLWQHRETGRPRLLLPNERTATDVAAAFDVVGPLYLAPPQRKPLTEEEIKQLLFESAGMTVTFSAVDLSLARAIERAHGIGGSDA